MIADVHQQNCCRTSADVLSYVGKHAVERQQLLTYNIYADAIP